MNNTRRKEIKRAIDLLTEANEIINAVSADEQQAIDNLPENLMYSGKADTMQEKTDELDSAESELTDIIERLQEI